MTRVEDLPLGDRARLAERLRGAKREAAEAVTDEFFRRHPDWLERYGERGRRLGVEDAGYHVEYLAGALEGGSVAAFEEYARWTTRVLSARGIAPVFLAENLRQLGEVFAALVGPSEARAITQLVEAGCGACEGAPGAAPPPGGGGAALAGERGLFLEAVLKGRRAAAAQIALEALREGHSIPDIYVELFQESQYEVGRLWESNRITVADEHMATAITQFAMARLYPHIEPAGPQRGRAVVTGVEGEMHQIGANMVADVMESGGWEVRFLGANVPHAGILAAVDEHGADLLGISATMLFNIPAVVRLMGAVRARPGRAAPKIMLGGAAFRQALHLPAELGADFFARDLREVLSQVVP